MLDISGCSRGKYIDIERIRKTIDEGPYDAVIVSSPQSVPHYSGFHNWDIKGLPERPHFVVWCKGAEPVFVVIERRKMLFSPGDTYISDVRTYKGEKVDCVRAIVEVLEERGVTAGKIGIEGRHLAAMYLMALQERLPKVRFEDAYEFLESREPSRHRPRSVAYSDQQDDRRRYRRSVPGCEPGDTERSIATKMESELLAMGGEMIFFHTFGAGHR